ncbi:MAG: hypothetical protein ABSE56_24060 [Bryobacteraceae bacterium]
MPSQIAPPAVEPGRLRIVLASPGDVQEERNLIPRVVEQINSEFRKLKSHLALEVSRYEVDSRPGYHVGGGPQAPIDRDLDIEGSDLVIGIFWNRFGTPTPSGETGTEHEIRLACRSKKERNRPEVMVYFREMSGPQSLDEAEQQHKVLTFKNELRNDFGVTTEDYASIEDFVLWLPHHLRLFAFERDLAQLPVVAPVLAAQLPVIPPVLACFVSAETRTIRTAGLAELVGDIELTCSSLDPTGAAGQFDIRVYTTPAQVTNKVTRVTLTEVARLTDAVIVDHSGRTIRGLLLPNVQTGDAPNTRNCLLFQSVSIWLRSYDSAPTSQPTGPKTFAIRNIRVAAPESSNTSIPATVSCYVDVHDSYTGAPQVVENRGVLVGTVETKHNGLSNCA